ncbi:hypothetical protein EGW08_008872 [Elysia chlorotica]|uniref:Calponin-homology (CH) domain-containing protein n=1 Tax=Elysia chlorotica TaxID=188477 RepID=A0A433TP57_ELYCH|nr:hypothetical protein EGW08_008872 [Elysia chlorotica]
MTRRGEGEAVADAGTRRHGNSFFRVKGHILSQGTPSRNEAAKSYHDIYQSSGLRLSDILSAARYALWCLVRALLDLWYLNPVYLVQRRWRQLHPLNTRMALSVRPRLIDLATDFFLSDERRKRQLLSWAKSMLPWVGDEDLFDFTASWQDGIVLCALVETLSPGACPRFNLLKPHQRVNNCRLGITLAQKYLQVAQVPLSPEEMAIADDGCEVKICHLVQLLKWKYQKQGSKPIPFGNGGVEEPAPCKCYARGTGLRAGIVGRRTKFNILSDAVTRLSLQIEIRGPNNEFNKEKIVSMYAGSTSKYGGHVISTSASALMEDDGKTKVIEDGAGHSFIRQRSLEEDAGHLVIPFDCQCVGEGRFLVSYIPRSAGTHHISVLQQGGHVQGSPFEVKVSDWVNSWNLVPKPRVVPFDMLQTIEERPTDTLKPSSAQTTDRIRKKLSQVVHVSKQLTMMKRRVLKKVITKRGGEEIICEVTPSPTLSRQSSVDFSDVSDDDKRKAGSRSISQESAKNSGATDKLSISGPEKAPKLRKSPVRTVKSSQASGSTRPASLRSENVPSNNEDKSNSGNTTSGDNFASIVSLAMQTASGVRPHDKTPSSQEEQIPCPIKLEVTQYDTESDGNCSDAKTRTIAGAGNTKLENDSSKDQSPQSESLKSVSDVFTSDSNRPAVAYNPRALCSKRPPSLNSTKSTSSSLSSFDKLPCTEVASILNIPSIPPETSEPDASIATTDPRVKLYITGAQAPRAEESKPKFTASNIVGTFLHTLSQGKKSGLAKSASLPLPSSKPNQPPNLVHVRGDSDAQDLVSPGSGQLDLNPPDVEGESTISQLQHMKQRTMSLSSQSSSSSHATRNPSRNVSPSPSRNVSPPSRNSSPPQSRAMSPSTSGNAAPPHEKELFVSDDRNSLDFEEDVFISPPSKKVSDLRNTSPSSSSRKMTSIEFKSVLPSDSRNKSPSKPKVASPSQSQIFPVPSRPGIGKETSHDNPGDSNLLANTVNPNISVAQAPLSTTGTVSRETGNRLNTAETIPAQRAPLQEPSSQLRYSPEDDLPGRDASNKHTPLDTNAKQEISNCLEVYVTTDDTSADSGNGIDKNSPNLCSNKNSRIPVNNLHKDKLNEHFPDDGICVSSSSNSNTEEQSETKPGNTVSKSVDVDPSDPSIEVHKKRHTIYVADKDEQDLLEGDLDFDSLAMRRGSASFDFSDYKPRHKITWSQHRSFSQERKLRKSLSCPSQSMGGWITAAKDRNKSPMVRKRTEAAKPNLAESSTSESEVEAKTTCDRSGTDEKSRNSQTKDHSSPFKHLDSTGGNGVNENEETLVSQRKSHMVNEYDESVSECKRLVTTGKTAESELDDKTKDRINVKRQKDTRTTKYHIQLLSASEAKTKDSGASSLTHTWSSSRGTGRDSFGKLRRKSSRRVKSLSVSKTCQNTHPYFFSLGDDPGSDVHSDDLFSRGKTDQMMVTGSSSPTSSCASASAAGTGNNVPGRTTSSLRRGRLARSKKWNTFDGDSMGSHQPSFLVPGATASLDQAAESGHSSGGGSDGAAKLDDTPNPAQLLHLRNSLKRRRASEGIGLKAENHEDEEGDEEDDEVLQIVIESKVLEYSNSPRRVNDDEFGNDDDEESIIPQSLTSGPTGDHSSLTQYESNAPTSVENSPLSHLGAPVVLLPESKVPTIAVAAPKLGDQVGFYVGSLSPKSGLSNRSDNSDWSDDELLSVRPDKRGDLVTRGQEDRVRGDWSPRLVDFSCRSESPLPKSLSISSTSGIEPSSTSEVKSPSSASFADPHDCKEQDVNTATASAASDLGYQQKDLSYQHEDLAPVAKVIVSCTKTSGIKECVDHQQSSTSGQTWDDSRDSVTKTKSATTFAKKPSDTLVNSSFLSTEDLIGGIHECASGNKTDEDKSKNTTDFGTAIQAINIESPAGNVSERFVNGQSNPRRLHRPQKETPLVSLRLRKMPMYEYEENVVAIDNAESLASTPRNAGKRVSPCRNCASDNEDYLKLSRPETNKPEPSSLSSPKRSPFFSSMNMLSPTASVCANADVWSTCSNSYTLSDSDLVSWRDFSLSDCCSSCQACKESKQAWPYEYDVQGEDSTGYFREKTLTPTKYRYMSNFLSGGLAEGHLSNVNLRKPTKWECRVKEERPSGVGFRHADEALFCFRCAEEPQVCPGRGASIRNCVTHCEPEPGDVLLTPTKFKRSRALSSSSTGPGRIDSNSQTWPERASQNSDLFLDQHCSYHDSPVLRAPLLTKPTQRWSRGSHPL